MTEENKPLIDASITGFGGVGVMSPAEQVAHSHGDIPPFLRREPEPSTTGALNAEEQAYADADPDADKPVFDTQVDQTGQTELVVHGGEALVSNAPSELERDFDHSPHPGQCAEADAENPRATLGGNNPPEEPLSKDEMLKDMWKDITAYGRDSGRGAAALPRLGLRCIRAAADGLISTDKPKDGSKSDAVRIYERYAEQDSKHADHTKGGMKANAAKLNALIGLGCMTTVDGVDIADRTVKLREKMEEADLKPKALFAGLVDVARAQMESDSALTDEAIEAALGKPVKEKTIADEWSAIHKKIEKLVSGDGGVKDQTEGAVKIEEMVREHINNFAANEEKEEKIAFLMERGMTRAQAEELYSKK